MNLFDDEINLLFHNKKIEKEKIKQQIIEKLIQNRNIIDLIKSLESNKENVINYIYKCETKSKLKKLENKIDILNDISSNSNFENIFTVNTQDKLNYPNLKDFNILEELSVFPQFKQYENLTLVPKLTDYVLNKSENTLNIVNSDFYKSKTQEFISNYISPSTPYNSILLYHGVGVGKTCGALSIAENFIKYNKKRVLILTPNNKLWNSWKDEIFNITKEINKKNYNDFIQNTNKYKISFNDWINFTNIYKKERDIIINKIENKKNTNEELIELKKKLNITFSDFLSKKTFVKGSFLPIKNIQCTQYNFTIDYNESFKKIKKNIETQINEIYEFSTFTKIVNEMKEWQYQEKINFLKKEIPLLLRKYNIGINIPKLKINNSDERRKKHIFNDIYDYYINICELFKIKELSITQIEKKIKLPGITIKNYIQVKYSNRVIIMDEIHKVRNPEVDPSKSNLKMEGDFKKLKIQMLMNIARYGKENKIILLSATPMQSDADEIIDIINILLLNDKRSILDKSDIFDKNNNILENKIHLFINKIKGYISFVKGQNPLDFPIKLEPNIKYIENDNLKPSLESCIYEPKSLYTYKSKRKMDLQDCIQNFKLFKGTMKDYQENIWITLSRLGDSYNKFPKKNLFIKVFDIDISICKNQRFREAINKTFVNYIKEDIKINITSIKVTKIKNIIIRYNLNKSSNIIFDKISLINNIKFTKLFTESYTEDLPYNFKIIVSNRFWNIKGFLGSKSVFHSSIMTFPNNENIIQELEIVNQKLIHSDVKENYLDIEELKNIKDKILENCIGEKGFNKCISRITINEYKKYQINDFCETFLDIDQIENYSSKLYNILRLIFNSKGIVFIYSTFIKDSIDVLQLMLERNGFKLFNKDQVWNKEKLEWESDIDSDLLIDEQISKEKRNYEGILFSKITDNKKKIQGRFIVCKSGFNYNDLREANGEMGNINKNGEHIKIILGSPAIQVGYNLKRIRQLHIIDPWYHLNVTDQVIGRGMRFKSHHLLNFSERNITVFMHSSSMKYITNKSDIFTKNLDDIINKNQAITYYEKLDKTNLSLLETTDEYMYRHSYIKSKNMSKVNRLLQKYSIDCKLNKNINILTKDTLKEVPSFNLITFQNKEIPHFKLGNDDYTWVCDFDTCEYSCNEHYILEYPSEIELEEEEIINYLSLYKIIYSIIYLFKLEIDIDILLKDINIENKTIKLNLIYQCYNINQKEKIINQIELFRKKNILKKLIDFLTGDITISKFKIDNIIEYEKEVNVYNKYIDHLGNKQKIIEVKKIIKNLYLKDFSYTLEEILTKLSNFKTNLIYTSLDDIVNNNEIVFDSYLREGYIIYRYNKEQKQSYYIFQPHLKSKIPIFNEEELNINNQDLDLKYEQRILLPSNTNIKLNNLSNVTEISKLELNNILENKKVYHSVKKIINIDNIRKIYKSIIETFEKSNIVSKNLYPNINNIKEKYLGGIRIDHNSNNNYSKILGPFINKNDEYFNSVPLPTINDINLMIGFSLLDNLDQSNYTNILEWTFKKALFRTIYYKLKKEEYNDLWEEGSSLIKYKPSLELVVYHYFIGKNPEQIEKLSNKVFENLTIVKIKKGEYKGDFGLILEYINEYKIKVELYSDCIKKGVILDFSYDYLERIQDTRNQIFYKQFEYSKKGDILHFKLIENASSDIEETIYLPFMLKYVSMIENKGQEIFRYIQNFTINELLDENSLDYTLEKVPDNLTSKYILEDVFVKPPPTSKYESILGYTSISDTSGYCQSNNILDLNNFNNEKAILDYLNNCFFMLHCGPGNLSSNKKGKKMKEAQKNVKIPLINKIISGSDNYPFTINFQKYYNNPDSMLLLGNTNSFIHLEEPKGKLFDLLKTFQIIDSKFVNIKLNEIKKENSNLNIFNKFKNLDITSPNQKLYIETNQDGFGFYNKGSGKQGFSKIVDGDILTLELQLLFRFFRFINKSTKNHIFNKWYIRKNEMYFWLKTQDNPRLHIITEKLTNKCGS